MDLLFAVQLVSFSITATLAFTLAVSRICLMRRNTIYENSRWMLLTAMIIFALHFLLQMKYGLRAKGDDLGALANIIFYTPSGFLLTVSQLYLQRGGRKCKRYVIVSLLGYALILAVIGIGRWANGSWHIGNYLYLAVALFMICIAHFIISPARDLHRLNRRIDAETGNPAEVYVRTMRMGTILMYTFNIVICLSISYTKALFIVCPLALLAMTYYVVCFTALGFNMAQVADVLADHEEESEKKDNEKTQVTVNGFSTNKEDEITQAVTQWIAEGGMRDSDASMVSVARRIGVSRQDLSTYLNRKHGCTFRIWLSNVRLEEAKRLVMEHEDYSNETIAQECGFSSASQLYRVFKAATGSTPREWRESQR
ncbi:MAG: AraC family transcriptional regulator [Bacteroidales bacterium]|nr:AraC family transcriptional regulator [Candidatus Sodaliphilus fimicaballi]